MSNYNFPPASEVFPEPASLYDEYVQHISSEITAAFQKPAFLGGYEVLVERLPGDRGFPRNPDFERAAKDDVVALRSVGYTAVAELDGRSGNATFTIGKASHTDNVLGRMIE